MIQVFSVELCESVEVALTWELKTYEWFTAEEAHSQINFRGSIKASIEPGSM
jgi:hypothetical protein